MAPTRGEKRKAASRTDARTAKKKKGTRNKEKDKNKKEPDIKWQDSKAKKLLYDDIVAGVVPLTSDGVDNFGAEMALKEIYFPLQSF